ncbi:hypothetical protein RB594_003646 [Gaeumannomyces avenae]
MTARFDAMAALASDPFDDAPPEVKEYISNGPDEFQRWVRSKLGSRPRARDRDTKIRELEEENTRLKEQAKEKAQRQAEKQAEEIRRQAEENQNLRAELEKLRQSKQKSTAGTSEQAEQRAENIERQLAEHYAKEIENLRAELAKKIEELEAEKERLKQEAKKAKKQAELELRQQNTAGTDAVSEAPASGPLSSSAASSTASSEQESSAGSTDSASTSSTSSSTPRESQSDAPPTKPAPLEVDPGSGRKTPRGFLPINPPLGDAYAAPSSDPEPQSSSSSAQNAADIDMPDAADAAPPGSNPGAQSPFSSSLSSPPDSPSQDTADGFVPQSPQSAAHFTSAQFAPPAGPSRKRLPNGRTTAAGGTLTASGCSPLPLSSPPEPPLRSMHVNDMGPNLAKNLWNKFGPSVGGMIRIEGLSSLTSAELKEKIQQPDQEWDLVGMRYSLDERGACRVRLADPEGGFSVPDFSDAVPQEDPERFFDDICANPPKEVINYYVGPQCTNRKEQFNGLLHPGKLAKLAELRRQKAEERGDSRQDWEVAGVTTPYEHIGHRLSASCFHREDAHYWSANINLSGEKIWVVIKPESTGAFEAYVRGRYSSFDCDQWLRHHNLLIGPSTLRAAGIKFDVLSAQPGMMVVTRPGQYHMVVNRTPSFATAINFLMPGDSLLPEVATKVCKDCGLRFAKEEKLWDFEHVGKNQLSSRPKRAAALRPAVSSASSTSPSKKKRPAAKQINTDSPGKQLQKKLRELPPPKTLAENLTNKEAMLRGVKQLLAAKEMADSPQTSTGLKVRGQWFQQAAELYRLGLKHERSSAFFALLSVVALMSAMEKMRARIPSGFKQVPPEAYNAVFQQIGGTKRAFDDKMGRSRKLARVFNHKYRGLLLFVCFDNDSPSTISAFTKTSDGDVAELHMAIDNDKRAGALARIGNEFLGCILKDTAFRNGVWADRPYQQLEEMADEGLFDLITQTGISK